MPPQLRNGFLQEQGASTRHIQYSLMHEGNHPHLCETNIHTLMSPTSSRPLWTWSVSGCCSLKAPMTRSSQSLVIVVSFIKQILITFFMLSFTLAHSTTSSMMLDVIGSQLSLSGTTWSLITQLNVMPPQLRNGFLQEQGASTRHIQYSLMHEGNHPQVCETDKHPLMSPTSSRTHWTWSVSGCCSLKAPMTRSSQSLVIVVSSIEQLLITFFMLSFTLAHSTTSTMMLDVIGSQLSPIGTTWSLNSTSCHRSYEMAFSKNKVPPHVISNIPWCMRVIIHKFVKRINTL
jgi:hypothetical protein